MSSELSYGYLNLKLVRNALNIISQKDLLAKTILDYLDKKRVAIKALNNITTVDAGNKVRQAMIELSNDASKLIKLLKNNLKGYDNQGNEENLEEMVCFYILMNFKLLLPEKLDLFFPSFCKDINYLININDDSLKSKLAIILRMIKNINDFLQDGNLKGMLRFTELLHYVYSNKNIIYSVYYGIYDGTPIKDINDFKNSDKVDIALLNSDDVLPDSIIKEFVTNEQLNDVKLNIIVSIIFNFFAPINIRENINYRYIAQRLFENDFNDLNSEAKLLNISSLLNNLRTLDGNNDDDFIKYLKKVQTGEFVLPPYIKGGLKNGDI